METSFSACAGCRRHVRDSESGCPFCGYVRVCPAEGPRLTTPTVATLALSAALLALGCKSEPAPTAEPAKDTSGASGGGGTGGSVGAMRVPDGAQARAGASGSGGAAGVGGAAGQGGASGAAGATPSPSGTGSVSPPMPTAPATTTQPIQHRPAPKYGMPPGRRGPLDGQ